MKYAGSLSPELRSEIEDLLRGSSEGLSHGATFRLREQGLNEVEISAKRRGVSVNTVRNYIRSLDQLFSGTIPDSPSAALRNSYVYRELLNHKLSPGLESYVKARLCELQAVNPEVRMDALQTRTFQYEITRPKRRK